MPEIRQNIATREWVIIATERAKRPEQFVQPDKDRVEDRPAWAENCPFCPGNEEIDLECLRIPVSGDWQMRVVGNRYPALGIDGELVRTYNGIHRSISGVGYHEVLVESRLHNTCPALEPLEAVELTLQGFLQRGQHFHHDPRIEHVVYFKNHGISAGASLLHPHTQLIALPVVPNMIRLRSEEARRYFDDHGQCVMCCMLDDERREQVRIISETEHFCAFVPYAAFSPFHVWIVPRQHQSSYLSITPPQLHDLSMVLRDVLRRVHFGLNDPDYNYVIRSSPKHEINSDYSHWYLGVVPRLTRTAGFEMSSGMYINTTLPEDSARFLRDLSLPPG